MADEPKPMDPERLAGIRELVNATTRPGEHWRTVRRPGIVDVVVMRDGLTGETLVENVADEWTAEALAFGPSDIAALLAAYDAQAARADAAERDRSILRGALVSKANDILAVAVALGWDPEQPVEEPGELVAAIDDLVARAKRAGDAEAEATRLRARVRVTEQDADESSITPAQALAWALAHGWEKLSDVIRHGELTEVVVGKEYADARIPLLADAIDYPSALARAIRDLGDASGTPHLDILDEMAAMPVEPKP